MLKRLDSTWQTCKQIAHRIHADERGAEGLEKLLIVAAIVLPLLGLLIIFRDYLSEWVSEKWDDVKSDADASLTEPTG